MCYAPAFIVATNLKIISTMIINKSSKFSTRLLPKPPVFGQKSNKQRGIGVLKLLTILLRIFLLRMEQCYFFRIYACQQIIKYILQVKSALLVWFFSQRKYFSICNKSRITKLQSCVTQVVIRFKSNIKIQIRKQLFHIKSS